MTLHRQRKELSNPYLLSVFFERAHRKGREGVLELLLVPGADHQHVVRVDDDEVLKSAQGDELPGVHRVNYVVPALLYQTKGTKLSDANIDNFKLNAKVGYLEVPVQIQWGPDLLAFRPYIFAEPFVGYGLFAKAKDNRAGETLKTSSFEKSGLSRWEYGLGLGAGVEVWRFQVSAKYFWNFGSLYSSDGELNQVGQTIKSAFKDGRNFNGVTISLAYMF